MKYAKLLLLLVVILAVTACNKNDNDNGDDNPATSMDGLNVSPDFSFENTKVVNLEVTLPFTVDYSVIKVRVDIYTAAPSQGGKLLLSGSANDQGVYSSQLTIPAHLETVYVSTFAGDAVVDLLGGGTKSIQEGGVNFGNGYDTIAPMDTAEAFLKDKILNESIVPFDEVEFFSQNLIVNGDFNVNDFTKFNNWPSPMDEGKWYYTNTFNNKVYQYNDNGNNVLWVNKPNRSGGVAQLIDASPGDLITFSADFKGNGHWRNRAWLFIIGRRANQSSFAYYSKELSTANSNEWGRHTVSATMPNGTESVQILLWMWNYGQMYWDNVVVTGPITDSDGDGVDDDQDDYVNDANRAYNIYYPSEDDWGSLAFEDNWPGKGDYDFNDLVMDYNYKQVANADNELVDLEAKFLFKAAGATLTNGFGFEMNMNPNNVSTVTGYSISDNYITLSGNGLEANQSTAVVIVTDNVFTQLPHPGAGLGVNTTHGAPYVTPTQLTINMTLSDPVSLNTLGSPPYNPFMIVDQDRGREVHLSDKAPTSLMNTALFGTEHDDSNPSAGKYFKTQNNLPWGIDLPSAFAYPVEKAEIINAHMHFGTWAESSGNSYNDWYLEKAGYRNDGNIYSVSSGK